MSRWMWAGGSLDPPLESGGVAEEEGSLMDLMKSHHHCWKYARSSLCGGQEGHEDMNMSTHKQHARPFRLW